MLDEDKILSIVGSELSHVYGNSSSTWPSLEEALNYYLGNPNGREVEGRSQVTSTDVADAIEWIMPQIMKSFTQNNEVVVFDPTHEGDERQAEIESQYVYEVLMKQNDGFVLIHQFVKDALMQRNGILKVYYDDNITEWTSQYTGISEQELSVLASQSDADILELSEYEDPDYAMAAQAQNIQSASPSNIGPDGVPVQPPIPMLYNVTVLYTSSNGRVMIDSVPLEEFRINNNHNSICTDTARFTAHVLDVTKSDLIKSGIDESKVEELPSSASKEYKDYRFSAQGEDVPYDSRSIDPSQDTVEVAECYMMIDIDEDGISELCKISVVGAESPTHVLSVEEIDCYPWIATTAIIMSHKFQGLSIFDRLKEIQDQKTALLRSMFDNIYFQNNQRTEVVESQVNVDDMLISRPNGIVRVKRAGSVTPIITPQLSPDSHSMVRYLDEIKAGRSGVSAEGGSAPQNIGDRVGSQGVERLMNSKEELVGMIIRVVAETGIKPLCVKIRDLVTKNTSSIQDFKFRGEWQKIQPSMWPQRISTTVRVGTGTGNAQEKVGALQHLMLIQEKILLNPGQTLMEQQQAFNTLDEYCKQVGLLSADKYFIDPSTQQGQALKQQMEQSNAKKEQENTQIQTMLAKAQDKLADAEGSKAAAQQASVQHKAVADNTKNELQLYKQTSEAETKMLKQQLDEMTAIADSVSKSDELQFRYDEMNSRRAIEMARIESTNNKEINNNVEDNMDTLENE